MPAPDLIQNIILRLQQTVEGQGKLIKEIDSVRKSLGKNSSATKTSSQLFGKMGATVGKLAMKYNVYLKVATAVVAATIAMIKQQKVYLTLQAQLGPGTEKFASALDTTYTSMRDLAGVTAEFSKMGFAQFFMAQSGEMTKAAAAMQETMVKLYGSKEIADEYFKGIMGAASGSSAAMRSLQKSMQEVSSAADLQDIADQVMYLGEQGGIMAEKLSAQAMKGGPSGGAAALAAMGAMGKEISSTFANLKDAFMAASAGLTIMIKGLHIVLKGILIPIQLIVKAIKFMTSVGEKFWGIFKSEGAKAAEERLKARHQEIQTLNEMRLTMKALVTDELSWARGLDAITKKMTTISSIIKTMGPSFEVAGVAVSEMMEGFAEQMLEDVFRNMQKVASETVKWQREIRKVHEELNKTQDDDKRGELEAALTELQSKSGDIWGAIEKASKAVVGAQKGMIAPMETQLEIAKSIKGIAEARLAISKAAYGTAALGVKAQMDVVKSLSMEKQALKGVLQQTVKMRKELQAKGEDVLYLQLEELKYRKQIADVTARQLQQVKELRDGYIDAVQAQAFASGRFEKIIISQEKNIGKALDANMVKKNYLLGSTGGLGISGVRPIRFGITGAMEMGGKPMTLEDVMRQQLEHMRLMPDELSRAISAGLSSIYLEGIDDLTSALETSNDLASEALRRTGGLRATAGGRGGEVAQGEALRRGRAARAVGGFIGTGGGELTKKARNIGNELVELMQMVEEAEESGDEGASRAEDAGNMSNS